MANINFSLLNTPSFTKTEPDKKTILLFPDIEFLSKFAKGDLGIEEQIKIKSYEKILSKIKDKNLFDIFVKNANLSIDENNKVTLDNKVGDVGLKALEKTIFQSIFETQKPYMDMLLLLTKSLAKIEDVVALSLCVSGSSLKPKFNERSLSYLDNQNINGENINYKQVSNLATPKNKSDTNKKETGYISENSDLNTVVENIKYSTGEFKSDVNYEYVYNDLENDKENNLNAKNNNTTNTSRLPKTIIVGVYDDSFNLIDENIVKTLLSEFKVKYFGKINQFEENLKNSDIKELYKKSYLSNIEDKNSEIYKNIDSLLTDELLQNNLDNLINNFYLKNLFDNLSNKKELKNNSYVKIQKPFIPTQINYNGRLTYVDVETNYDLKLIKYIPKINTKTNIKLDKALSNGVYGTPYDNFKQEVDVLLREKKFFTDKKIYYIIEGVLSDDNVNPIDKDDNNNSSVSGDGGSKNYKPKDIMKLVPKFIDLLVALGVEFLPELNKLLELLKNPTNFVCEIIMEKLSDNVEFLNTDFIKNLAQLSNISNYEDKLNKVKSTILDKYVFIDKNTNRAKFILDGVGDVKLFGDKSPLNKLPKLSVNMKLDISNSIVNPIVKPISFNFNLDKKTTKSDSKNNNTINANNTNRLNEKGQLDVNYYGNNNDINTTIEDIDIKYSTGEFKTGVDYEYIYLTEKVEALVLEAKTLEENGDVLNAVLKIKEAIGIENDSNVLKSLSALLEALIASNNAYQPLLGLILNIVFLPIKLVFKIVTYIVDFFNSLKDPFTLVDKIITFISFKWITDFFNPTSEDSLFAMLGLEVNLKKYLTEWLPSINAKVEKIYDMNDIIKFPWITKFPSYNLSTIKNILFDGKNNLTNIIIKMFFGIFSLIEQIINKIIEFIWALLGLNSIIKSDDYKIDLTTKLEENTNLNNIISLLSGTNVNLKNENEFFVYDIILPNGETISSLDYEKLNSFIDSNNDINFSYNFDIN